MCVCVCARVFSSLPLLPCANRDCWHPFPSSALYGWVKLDDAEKKKGVRGSSRGSGGGFGEVVEALLDGILVTWGELLSSFNPATPFPRAHSLVHRQNAVSGG